MRTIKLNNKIYTLPAETIIDYLSYRKIVNNNINADDAIHMYVENIKRYYAEKEMAYNVLPARAGVIPTSRPLQVC